MDVATEQTVLGDFNDVTFTHRGKTSRFYRRDGKFLVETEGPDGTPGEFEVKYVFGVRPLQQYLVPFPGGRLQCLTIAWDTAAEALVPPLPRPGHPADRLAALDAQRAELERHVRRVPLHQPEEGLRRRRRRRSTPRGPRSTSAARPATARARATSRGRRCRRWRAPRSSTRAWSCRPRASRRPQLVELCAPCHSRRAELGDYDHTGRLLLDHMLPSLLTEGLYEADGQQQDEVYTYASFLQSKMYARGVRCSDCHDSHSAQAAAPGQRALPAVPPARGLRHRRPPLPQEGGGRASPPTARCA